MKQRQYTGMSLFTGAGGMDIGFKQAGINVLVANEIDKDACKTYEVNNPETLLVKGDIRENVEILKQYQNIDIVFGGPPCQGFSVAGKMDPNDERSKLIWDFLDIVKEVRPKAFVMENVKALAQLEKWSDVREKIIKVANANGYCCYPYVLNSVEFGVPQKRERVLFIGFLNKNINPEIIKQRLEKKKKKTKTIRETIAHLGRAGSETNPNTCTAKITLAANPIMRKSPYAGMLFNGMGRPLNLDDASNTLPASMGGNKTPIIDEELLHGVETVDWCIDYHQRLIQKQISPKYTEAPERLRRLTAKEAALIQTFPEKYRFEGSKTAIYRQIGNAVPCELAKVVAQVVIDELNDEQVDSLEPMQYSIEDFMNR